MVSYGIARGIVSPDHTIALCEARSESSTKDLRRERKLSRISTAQGP